MSDTAWVLVFYLLWLLFWTIAVVASYLIMLWGGDPVVAVLAVPGLGVVSYVALVFYRQARRERRLARETARILAEPCEHGTQGARLDPTRCASCTAEATERARASAERAAQDDARIEAEQAALRAEATRRRQAEYNDHLKRIRLPSYLSRMDPRQFELTVCEMYRRLGYDVRATPFAGDSGVDGYLRRDGKLLILQCKRVQGSVGQPEVRDLFGTIAHEEAQGGIIVTTGRVSRQAREWVSGKPIQIVEIEELMKLIRQTFSESEVVPKDWKCRGR